VIRNSHWFSSSIGIKQWTLESGHGSLFMLKPNFRQQLKKTHGKLISHLSNEVNNKPMLKIIKLDTTHHQ
jgi:hypothetical protein